jgi:putative addiction module killer protein
LTYEIRQTDVYVKWEQSLRDSVARAAITARIVRLSKGNFGDVKPVGDGVSEIRIHYGPGYRIYFQRKGSTIIILLCGGDKGSQEKDIARAKQLAGRLEF